LHFFLEYLLLQLNFATKTNFWPITSCPTIKHPPHFVTSLLDHHALTIKIIAPMTFQHYNNFELLLWKNLKCHFHDSLRHTMNHILHCRESYQRNYGNTFSQPLEGVPTICFRGLISWNWGFKTFFHPLCFQ
jgi:hypothetical protein